MAEDRVAIENGSDVMTRRFVCCALLIGLHAWLCCGLTAGAESARPNVVLIMTDDQGIGDFGATGNRVMETPHLDQLAADSATMSTFYVSPVCSPTRACLMTGRYNYRTRCIDTWLGRSMMDPAEVTVAELLSQAGYATGIFGKWHLGDCYPMRPMDQGFEEVLVHRGGGLAQPSEPRENNRRYTDPILFHNGEQVQTTGFCTDVYFDAALEFIEDSHRAKRNFFVYIPTNAPHGPFDDVPEELRLHYMQKREALAGLVVQKGREKETAEKVSDQEIDKLARISAMVTNVDQNVDRLLKRLEKLSILENTLVIFLTDNGPNSRRYVGQRRGTKGEILEGGIRTVLWLHWPARLAAGTARQEPAAHIDLMPTILDACDVACPNDLKLDGLSMLPLLEDDQASWPERTLTIQSQRGDVPFRYHNFMIRDQRWKLLHASGFGRESFEGKPKFELYDVVADPEELANLAVEKPQIVKRLRSAYDKWFDDVSSTRPHNYDPPRIWIGTPHEKVTVLTRQDWRGGTWAPDAKGAWLLYANSSGSYNVDVQFDAHPQKGSVELMIGSESLVQAIERDATDCRFENVSIPAGNSQLTVELTHKDKKRGVYQVSLQKN